MYCLVHIVRGTAMICMIYILQVISLNSQGNGNISMYIYIHVHISMYMSGRVHTASVCTHANCECVQMYLYYTGYSIKNPAFHPFLN